MNNPIKILLQTTIVSTDNDWHIGRFSLLRDFLAGLSGADFVSETPGNSLATTPHALRSVHRYVSNVALWLAGRLNPAAPVNLPSFNRMLQ
ncbi:hypothetical protein [Collimonas sp.]|jgi:hypothetical protein|uniref:hypothetical protein n=1 Tax=Collimonas sp. TaxID=1963772 RepID=UPI002BA93086|nr:hypothetical protein [Collimonas sp.]HWW07284.1 hypothetical protein [Collimonas sp.]